MFNWLAQQFWSRAFGKEPLARHCRIIGTLSKSIEGQALST
jgi:hypothetical protein